MTNYKIGAYYYPGWHHCPVRDHSFPKGWSEWDLVYDCKPRFDGHDQPKLPLWGRYDESQPDVFAQKLNIAQKYGVDLFIFAYYWSRGKRLLEGALNQGYLKTAEPRKTSFALMWANRMPRRVMPVKDAAARIIDPSRLVYTDPSDFIEFIKHVATHYFCEESYFKVDGAHYLSIFDTAFFIRQLGYDNARNAIKNARDYLAEKSLSLHLAAIDPIAEHQPMLKSIGFDSVTHYVFLPEWSGPLLQDFNQCAQLRAEQWQHYQPATELPYVPSVSPGWDANPRAADHGKEKPGKYPWSPVVTKSSPENFAKFLAQAAEFAHKKSEFSHPFSLISSWNEWSEGHYLEPDEKHGYAWLEAIRKIKQKYG